ncbi:hypothetical protein ACFXHA_40915 [Nocardia sp. NPDC059240]|uniref:hypothetical protein n=1 Tax=Nocardia sp. NPDC059240 TaxID=3346786 RepID=UPI0036C65382
MSAHHSNAIAECGERAPHYFSASEEHMDTNLVSTAIAIGITGAERFAVGIVAAGGLIMVAGVRPLLLAAQSPGSAPNTALAVEKISVGAWNRYNRASLIASVILAVIEVVRLVTGTGAIAVVYLIGALTMAAILTVKLRVDAALATRAASGADSARGISGDGTHANVDLDRTHALVERLSVPLLVIAVLLALFPVLR